MSHFEAGAERSNFAVVILVEKVWKYGCPFSKAVGGALLYAAILVPWHPWLLPGLHMTNMTAM